MNYSVLKSFGKAFRAVAITTGSVAAAAGLLALQNPEVVAPIVAVGPFGPIVALAVQGLAVVAFDALKHRNKE